MEPKKISIAEKIAEAAETVKGRALAITDFIEGTAKFTAAEIAALADRVVPGFMDLRRIRRLSDAELEEDIRRLRKERMREDLKANGYGRTEATWGIPEPERFEGTNGVSFRELGRQAVSRNRGR